MKKEQRDIYLQLANLPNPPIGLCNMCQYAEFEGDVCDCVFTCHHPLEIIAEEEPSCEVWAGDDCWGFRPCYSFEDTIDMVGILLQGKWPDMSRCKCKKAYKEA